MQNLKKIAIHVQWVDFRGGGNNPKNKLVGACALSILGCQEWKHTEEDVPMILCSDGGGSPPPRPPPIYLHAQCICMPHTSFSWVTWRRPPCTMSSSLMTIWGRPSSCLCIPLVLVIFLKQDMTLSFSWKSFIIYNIYDYFTFISVKWPVSSAG